MSAVEDEIKALVGRKGGGKGGGGGSQNVPTEEPNTLRSAATARIIDLLGEGEIGGLVDGLKSVYYDDTPVQNEDGSYNFQGVKTHERVGLPDQAPVPGQKGVERETDVSVQVTTETPIVRTITDLDVDAVRVKVQVPALTYQDPETGDLRGTEVQYAVDVRPNGGTWSLTLLNTISGKTTSPYQRARRVDLFGEGPWDIRFRRVTDDSTQSNLRDETYWASYTEVIDAKLIYPDSALVGTEVDARQFGSDIPSRKYDVYGLILSVPSNYNPSTREYSGLWDGTFKRAWSDNPAWVFYDLATHRRYGANIPYADKWSLYQIGQYCDELIDDGFGGQEPRFTFNTVIAEQSDVYNALNQLASVFRGMLYWGSNTIMPVADMPAEPVKLVTPSNVIGGEFEYSGASRTSKHSAAIVSYNDPDSNDRLVPEVIERGHLIEKYGWRPLEITAVACNSRGQAHRVGAWALDTEENEGETVSYRATTDHTDVRPGDLIELSDPNRAGARLGGRFTAVGTTSLTLDQVPDEALSGETWYLDAVMPTGGIERREIASFDGNEVTLASSLSNTPALGANWILSSASVNPRLFRIVANKENAGDDGSLEHQITALEHDPTKYARIEQGIYLPAPDTSLIPTGLIEPPRNITVESYSYTAGGTKHQAITVSLTPSDDPRAVRYIIEAKGPSDIHYRTLSTNTGTSADLLDAESGQWAARARSVDGLGRFSAWVYKNENVAGRLQPLPPESVDIVAKTFSITLIPNGLTPGSTWEYWKSNAALDLDQIESNANKIGYGPSLSVDDLTPGTPYYFYIRGYHVVYGVSSFYPVQATTQDDVSAILKAVNGRLKKTALDQILRDEIDLITAPESVAGSVNARLSTEQAQRLQDIADTYADFQQGDTDTLSASKTYADTDSQAAQTIDALVATFGGSTAGALSYTISQADSTLAITQTFDQIDARFDSIDTSSYATVSDLSSAQADDESARSQLQTTIAADYNTKLDDKADINASGLIIENGEVAIDATHGPFAQATKQVSINDGDSTATLQEQFTAQRSDIGGLQATWTIRINGTTTEGDPVVGGLGLGASGGSTRFIVDADEIAFGKINQSGLDYPFYFDSATGRAIVKNANIGELTFTKLKASDGSLIVQNGRIQADYLDVDNLQVNYSAVIGPKPPDDADKTSANTAADTAKINGRSSSSVTSTLDSTQSDASSAIYQIRKGVNNLVETPVFENGNTGAWTSNQTDGGQSLKIYTRDTFEQHNFDVMPGERLFFRAYIYAYQSTTHAVNFGIHDLDAGYYKACGVGPGGAGTVTGWLTVASGVTRARAWLQISASSNYGTAYVKDLYIGRYQPGSDVTSENTANDTARVDGQSAATIRDRAYRGAVGSNTVNDWTASGTTLINGGRIKADTLSVGTLQIKNRAVTQPSLSVSNTDYLSGSFTSGSYRKVLSKYRSGSIVVGTDAQITITGIYNARGNSSARLDVKLVRGGTTLYEGKVGYQDSGSIEGSYSIPVLDDGLTPGQGATYELYAKFTTFGGDEVREHTYQSIGFVGLWR